MTEAQLIHDWDELCFCIKCGASMQAVVNGDREKQCNPPDNLTPISCIIAQRRQETLISLVLG